MSIATFFILDKSPNINENLSTHIDIIDISAYNNEKEILFLPFSSFEIVDINQIIFKNINCYKIKLKY